MSTEGHDVITDPCRETGQFSSDRFFQFLPAILIMAPGSVIVFIFFKTWPFDIQIASSIAYTATAFFYTFSGNGLSQSSLDCPIVQHHLDSLKMRHCGFLLALIFIETIGFKIRPHLPDSWLVGTGKNMSPFILTLSIACGSLLLTQVITNRAMLDRAHGEQDTSER
jgi:hypothetical protein